MKTLTKSVDADKRQYLFHANYCDAIKLFHVQEYASLEDFAHITLVSR